MLTRIRNACKTEAGEVSMPSSKLKAAIAGVLRDKGYIGSYREEGDQIKTLHIELKYQPDGTPVIEGLRRVSKPSQRVYVGSTKIPRVLGGLGTAVLSTSKGVMSDRQARSENLGGEVLCYVW
jgi:small subunit ribosomal protein S8